MRINDTEFSKMVKSVATIGNEVTAKKRVKEAYDILMGQKPSRRKWLERNYQRMAILRRAYESGYEQGKAEVQEAFKEILG